MSEAAQLLNRGTWIQPGPATLVVRDAGWVLLVPGMKKEVVEAAWTVLGDGPTADDFPDKLVKAGGLESLDKLPAILYALMEGTTTHIGVKGKSPLVVYDETGSRLVAGTDEEPFTRLTVEGVRRIAFGDLPPEEPLGGLRLEAGVSRVRGFVQAIVDPADLADDARTALAEQVEQHGRSIEDPEAKKRRAEKPPPPAPKPAATSESVRKPMMATRPSGAMPTSRSASTPAKPAESAGPSVFDDLFGDKKPEPAAAQAPAATATPAAAPATPAPAPPTPAAAPATQAPNPPEPAPAPTPEPAAKGPDSAATSGGSPSSPAPSTNAVPSSQRDAGTAPEDDAVQAPAKETPAATPPAGKRRLVSTSLFDRKRRPAAGGDEARTSTADPAAAGPASASNTDARTAGSAPAPAPESQPSPEPSSGPAAPPQPAPAVEEPSIAPGTDQQRPSATRRPSPAASMPTPPPPDEDDSSPVTLVAPIDQDDAAEGTSTPDPSPDSAGAKDQAASSSTPAATLGFGTDLDATGAYDDLFGKTVFRSIEDAAVRRTEEDEHDEDEASTEAAGDSPEQADGAQDDSSEDIDEDRSDQPETLGQAELPTADAASSAIGGEFIDWVPGVGRSAPEIAQTAARRASQPAPGQPAYPQVHLAERPPAPVTGPPRAVPPDYGSAPVPREGLGFGQQPGTPSMQAQPGQQAGPQQYGAPFPGSRAPQAPPHSGRAASAPHPVAPSGPPPMAAARPNGPAHPHPPTGGSAAPAPQAPSRAVMIPGVICPNGHANSPERHQCRTCGGPLEHSTRSVPRPPLGYVEISTGNRVVLDRSAVIGRRPRASRVSADDVPQLVTVPSPQQDISRSHVELRLEGWHVVATDLGTTNGTTLIRPGTEPVRLRAGEGVVLGEGDQLDLGDGVRLMMRGMA